MKNRKNRQIGGSSW